MEMSMMKKKQKEFKHQIRKMVVKMKRQSFEQTKIFSELGIENQCMSRPAGDKISQVESLNCNSLSYSIERRKLEKVEKCDKCGFEAQLKDELKEHINKEHNSEAVANDVISEIMEKVVKENARDEFFIWCFQS